MRTLMNHIQEGPSKSRSTLSSDYDVIVIGAGPYGLSARRVSQEFWPWSSCIRRTDGILGDQDA